MATFPPLVQASLQPVSRRLRSLTDRCIARSVGGEDRPALYDVRATCPALLPLQQRWREVRDELDRVRARIGPIPRYEEADPAQTIASQDALAWRTLYVCAAAHPEEPNEHLFPRTAALVRAVPGVLAAFFSILEPGKCVPRHRAPMLAHLRYHLGLHVPELDPPFLRLAGRVVHWEEGRGMLWDDTLPHEVVNRCAQERVVLIVDLLRPLPAPLAVLNRAAVRLARASVPRRVRREAAERRRVAVLPAATPPA